MLNLQEDSLPKKKVLLIWDPWSLASKPWCYYICVPCIGTSHFMAEPDLVRHVIRIQFLEHNTYTCVKNNSLN